MFDYPFSHHIVINVWRSVRTQVTKFYCTNLYTYPVRTSVFVWLSVFPSHVWLLSHLSILTCCIFLRLKFSCYIFLRVELRLIFSRVYNFMLYFSMCEILCYIFWCIEFGVIYFYVWNFCVLFFCLQIFCVVFFHVWNVLVSFNIYFCVVLYLPSLP